MEKYYEDVVRLRILRDRPADEIERFRIGLCFVDDSFIEETAWEISGSTAIGACRASSLVRFISLGICPIASARTEEVNR